MGAVRGGGFSHHAIKSKLPGRDLVIHGEEIQGLPWVTLVILLLWLHIKGKVGTSKRD